MGVLQTLQDPVKTELSFLAAKSCSKSFRGAIGIPSSFKSPFVRPAAVVNVNSSALQHGGILAQARGCKHGDQIVLVGILLLLHLLYRGA
jgi:hypothetical protein